MPAKFHRPVPLSTKYSEARLFLQKPGFFCCYAAIPGCFPPRSFFKKNAIPGIGSGVKNLAGVDAFRTPMRFFSKGCCNAWGCLQNTATDGVAVRCCYCLGFRSQSYGDGHVQSACRRAAARSHVGAGRRTAPISAKPTEALQVAENDDAKKADDEKSDGNAKPGEAESKAAGKAKKKKDNKPADKKPADKSKAKATEHKPGGDRGAGRGPMGRFGAMRRGGGPGPGGPPNPDAMFKRMDKNGDGMLTLEEFAAAAKQMRERAENAPAPSTKIMGNADREKALEWVAIGAWEWECAAAMADTAKWQDSIADVAAVIA